MSTQLGQVKKGEGARPPPSNGAQRLEWEAEGLNGSRRGGRARVGALTGEKGGNDPLMYAPRAGFGKSLAHLTERHRSHFCQRVRLSLSREPATIPSYHLCVAERREKVLVCVTLMCVCVSDVTT